MHIKSTVVLAAGATLASAQVAPWGQCGGIKYTGPTTCTSGHVCTAYNPYYSQCVPGTSNPSPTTTGGGTPSTTTTNLEPPLLRTQQLGA
ncbi:hypothetical protein BDZ91DRAFT_846087 [Kalaharituber pfeilii]|nr:hypothetical protein BDZ91DRAFT_846087 [Kalaharituber pfeilii]